MKTMPVRYINSFKKFKILVIGDMIVDIYLSGSCSRLAPEGSFPVVDLHDKKVYLGGAGNVAANLKALGCTVVLCTAAGNDDGYREAAALLTEAGITIESIVADEQRTTLVKTRVSAPGQTLVRFDTGAAEELSAETESAVISKIRHAYAACDAVLIADYKKGVVTTGIIEELRRLNADHPKFIAVDAKDLNSFAVLKPSLIKPNYEEALKVLSLSAFCSDRAEALKKIGQEFYQATAAGIIALTLDSDGALFFKDGEFKYRSYAPKCNLPAVSGAGDTFISTCLLALLSGAGIAAAAELATAAAALAVNKTGTSICTQQELLTSIAAQEKDISSLALLKLYCSVYRCQGKRIVFTNGCFDILHSGHVSYLSRAKTLGDILIVGLNTDESVIRLKGESRPVNKLADRKEVLSALSCIDHIISFGKSGDDTPVSLIKHIEPSVFVKGGDYQNKILPEGAILKALGCEVVFLPYIPNQSTTKIIHKIEETAKWKTAILN